MYMHKYLVTLLLCVAMLSACNRAPADPLPTPPAYMAEDGKLHFDMRVAAIANLPPLKGGVLFLGDSITEGGDWQTVFPNIATANHGVGWDTTDGVQRRLSQITPNDPDIIFLMIGTNNLFYDHSPQRIASGVAATVEKLLMAEPQATLYVQSVLPREAGAVARINAINQAYFNLSQMHEAVTYIDLHGLFAAENGTLRADLTYDGLHLNAAGYELWANAIQDLVYQE